MKFGCYASGIHFHMYQPRENNLYKLPAFKFSGSEKRLTKVRNLRDKINEYMPLVGLQNCHGYIQGVPANDLHSIIP